MPNRLAAATSPYLLQHADNPVDWWEGGDEAFEEAAGRNVPVLLSVGYAACHWCHVMAHESFEDPAVAAVMNREFVNVKVDREERPDVDAVYMAATQALTGQGGWPMTVFLTPQGQPFYAGTYFPPSPRHGIPSFRQLLQAISEAERPQRDEVEAAGGRIASALAGRLVTSSAAPDDAVLTAAVEALAAGEDAEHGGFGTAPKFPPSMNLEQLLRHAARRRLETEDDVEVFEAGSGAVALGVATRTLVAMARSGMYDQLAGGFARYSVDAAWVVPHFEKMLYDNAQLLARYAQWGTPIGDRVATGIADWLLRELRTAEGGFASALDADSEGEEGRFYVWTPQQLTDVLGPADGSWATELFAVTGTFEHGTSTLQLPHDADDPDRFDDVRRRLLAAREGRARPQRDDKVVAAGNGLAISGLVDAGRLLGREEYVDAALAAGELLATVHVVDGRLRRVSRDGRVGGPAGVLEDHGA